MDDRPKTEGTSLKAAFERSMEIAINLDKAVDRGFDKLLGDKSPAALPPWLDKATIKLNAYSMTPIVWTLRKCGLDV
jgi:hypothetical protein